MSTRVLVVGGGFAGVACTWRLAGQPGVEVTLLDQHGFHQFQPLLYQVATAELTPQDVRFDLAHIFRSHDNVTIRTSEVTSIDPDARAVTLTSGEVMTGDVLVLAAGTTANFFRVPGAAEYAFPLYSVADAERVRSRVLQLFDDAACR